MKTESRVVSIHGFDLCSVCVLCVGVCPPLFPKDAFPQGLGHDSFCSTFLHLICLCPHMSRHLFGFLAFESMNFQGFYRLSLNFRISMILSGSFVEPFLFSKCFYINYFILFESSNRRAKMKQMVFH